jgi:hypothetical protein
VRGAEYQASPTLAAQLVFDAPRAERAPAWEEAWSAALGGAPVLLVRSVARARALLLAASGVRQGEPVGLPANATRGLVEAVKRHGARPHFVPLDAALRLDTLAAAQRYARCAWLEPSAGLPVPLLGCASRGAAQPVATLYGLHLSHDARHDGALIVFGNTHFAAAVQAHCTANDQPNPALVAAQYHRLVGNKMENGLVACQQAALLEVAQGLHKAAGLPVLDVAAEGALAHGVAVRVPDECDPLTFYAYAKGEQTPVQWLPELRPVHYAALRDGFDHTATSAALARWLLVPVGPDWNEEEISHAVLGIVKAAEYTGMRWRTDPARAYEYSDMLERAYGPDHDAYRPLFALQQR